MAAAGQEPSPFSTENNFAAQLKAGMGVPGDSVTDMMVTVEQQQIGKRSGGGGGGKVPLFQNIDAKYDLFGMKIKSYTYQPSSSQTEQEAASVNNENSNAKKEEHEAINAQHSDEASPNDNYGAD